MISKKEVRTLFVKVPCRLQNAERSGWVWILYPEAEYIRLEGQRLADGNPGNPVAVPQHPGRPQIGSFAQANIYKIDLENYENYDVMLKFAREAIEYCFLEGTVLLSQRNTVGLITQHPLILYQFLWNTRATEDDKDDETDKAEVDLKAPFDPSILITQ